MKTPLSPARELLLALLLGFLTAPFAALAQIPFDPPATGGYSSDFYPPRNSSLDGAGPVQYPGTPIIARNVMLHSPATSKPSSTSPGQIVIVDFGMTFTAEVSSNGGASFSRVTAPAAATVRNTHAGPAAGGGTSYDTEMLQLTASGSALGGAMFRESPTRASLGRTTITDLGGGNYRIDSFFDIFTELSLDGGANWVPSPAPLHAEMHRLVPEMFSDTPVFLPPGRLVGDVGNNSTTYPPGAAVLVQSDLIADLGFLTFPEATTRPSIPGHVNEATFDLSLDGGATHERITTSGDLAVRITPVAPNGTHHQVEMLSMNLTGDYDSGGGGTVMIRESPTKASLGKTSVRQVQGGSMISTFFDVFTEISFDGGGTWAVAVKPIRIEMARSIPENGLATTFFPPRNGRFVVDDNDPPLLFGNGMFMRKLRVLGFRQNGPLAEGSTPQIVTSSHTATFETSIDGGATWQPRSAPGAVAIRVAAGDVTGDGIYDIEMLQLDIQGGSLPPGVMLRESPSRPSLGQLFQNGDIPTQQQRISSFFDIFTEISTDGGVTWSPADKPATAQMELVPSQEFYASDFLPLRSTFSSIDNAPEEKERFVGDNTPIIRGGALGGLNTDTRTPPPAPGATAMHSFFDVFVCEMSVDGGNTFVPVSAPATVTTRTTGVVGGTRTFDTEMLQLDIQGGTLPAGVMIRESPTRASLGRTSITSVDGGYRIGSFFDIFTEISIDNGATWLPAVQRARYSARALVDPVIVTSDFLPTRGELLVQAGDLGAQTTKSLNFTKIMWRQLSGPSVPPPAPGGVANVSQQGVADVTWVPGPGQPPLTARAPVNLNTVAVPVLTALGGSTQTFDTEMLSMSISGGGLPAGMMIRESPTLASTGRRTVSANEFHHNRVESFFDVFTEVSLDGGATWQATDRPLHAELVPEPVQVTLPAETLPRAATVSNAAGDKGRAYASSGLGVGKVQIQDFHFRVTSPPAPLPPTGGLAVADFNGDGRLDLVLPDGSSVSGACVVVSHVQVAHRFDFGATRVFDTEMLQLDLSGADLPPGVMLRESPSKASIGRTSVRALPGGTYRIDSFFDVFTEISLDGGASWSPSDGPLRLEAAPVPPPVPLDSTHFATTDFFPPPGTFALGDMQFPDGSMITGMTFTPAPGSPRAPLPEAGLFFDTYEEGSVAFTFTDPVGVVTHVTVGATLGLRVTGAPPGSDRFFDTEMLSLSLNGLPPGVPVLRIRESPTLQSTGGTRITETSGGFMVSSFFDVFTEISLDGGATWQQATGSSHAELQPQMPLVGVPTDYFPPRNGVLATLRNAPPLDFGGGHLLRTISSNDFHHNARLVDGAAPLLLSIPHTATFELSHDAGLSWQTHTAPATATVNITAGDVSNDGIFDTEMLQFDISGGTLPPGVMIRESPSLARFGKCVATDSGDFKYRIGSFFDIFTEISLDGGQTWLASTKPAHLELTLAPPADFHHSDFMPLGGITAMDDWEAPVAFINRPAIRNFTCQFVDGRRLPPPPAGTTRIDSWASIVEFQYSPNGDGTFTPVTAPATVTVRVTNNGSGGGGGGSGGAQTFDTEMLALDIQGGTLPAGVHLRESPSRPSLGRIQIDTTRGGFRISSFFDVFTELSLDGGATWSPATDTMHVTQRKDPLAVLLFSQTVPPLAEMEMLPGGLEPRAQGHHFPTAKLTMRKSGGSNLPSTPGAPVVIESVHTFLWDTADDLGVVTHNSSDANVVVRYELMDTTADGTRVYDTEMLALNLSGGGGGGGGGIMLRESPTRASLGQYFENGDIPNQNRVSSFFDVFTELSLDGGATWTLADVPLHFELLPAVQKVPLATETMPRAATVSNAAGTRGRVYPTGSGAGKVSIQDFHFVVTSPSSPLPAAGGVAIADLNGDGQLDLFLPDGTPVRAKVTLQCRARVTHDFDLDGTRYFDTEMLQLSLSSPDLPPGLLIRESPTLASTGRTSSRMLPGGSFVVDSFFDVFTELSLDGGATWTPSDGPLRLNPASVPPVQPLGSTHFATTDFFPPPGELVLGGSVTFSDGSTLDRLAFLPSTTSPRVPVPPPGVSVEVTLDGELTFHSSGGPLGNIAGSVPAQMRVLLTGGRDGDDRYFEVELLSLTLTGPSPVLIRESPSRPSLGATRITATDGGFMVSSFFDVFFDVSNDGGATWSSAAGPGHVELEPPTPENIVASNFYPPRTTALGTLRNAAPTEFAVLRVRNLRHVDYQANQPLVEAAGVTTEIVIPHTAEFEVSTDGGATWQPHSAPATARVRVAAGDVNGDGVFDTEMLQLNISGGSLPAGVMVRESPSKASLGRTTVRALPDGNFAISSFFDVFTELSLDNGGSWTAAHEAAHVVQQRRTQKQWTPSNFRFASGVVASDPDNGDAVYASSPAIVRAPSLSFTDTNQQPPPAPGQTRQVTLIQDMIVALSLDGGQTFKDVTAPATVTMSITNNGGGANGLGSFDTEMLALEVSGGTLPAGVMIRESPTRQSLGKTTIESVDGGFRIGSFFDVFTEISLDGGASWSPAADTLHLEERLTSGQPVIVDNDRIFSRGEIESLPGALAPLTQFGMHMEELALSSRNADGIPLPPVGSVTTATLEMDCALKFRQDFGPVQPQKHTARVTIRITPRDAFGNTRTFDTEMLALSLNGLPPGEPILRESPSRPSLGRCTVTDIGGGEFRIDSFFDVFTELSLDGGTTWSPTDVPMRTMLLPAIQKIRESASRLPQHAGVSRAADGRGLDYAGGGGGGSGGRIAFFDVFLDATTPLPPAGGSSIADLNGDGRLDFAAVPGGAVITHAVHVQARARIDSDSDDDGIRSFDTEMLQLNIAGATLPPGMLLRESPSLPSKGRTSVRQLPDGTWRVDSFFDVFTEISLDGGGTWQPSDGPMRLDFTGQQRSIVVAPGSGAAPLVKIFNPLDQSLIGSFSAYSATFTGGVRVSKGDVNGDGTADIITGAGAGGGPHVKVFSGVDNRLIRSFFAYPGFTGGVFVAAGDVDGDGRADIITGADSGAGPHVKVFSGASGAEIRSFFAYDPAFAGGVRVAAGDVNGDGYADIITGAGAGGQPHVKVFDGRTGQLLQSFFAYDPAFAGGVFVAAGDVNGDGRADIVCGADSGAAPQVRVFDGTNLIELQSFFAYPAGFTGGVRVAAGDVNGDGRADIITGAGAGGGPHVKVFSGSSGAEIASFFAYEPTIDGGIYVAGTPPPPRWPSTPLDDDGDGLLDAWEIAHFGTTDGHYIDDDSDDDGLSDLMELALGSNPNVPDAAGQLPVTIEGGYLTITINKQPGALYQVQSAGRLLPGLPDSFSPLSTTILIDNSNQLKVRDNIRFGSPPSRFIRAQITGAP